jgi:hypothetical protein
MMIASCAKKLTAWHSVLVNVASCVGGVFIGIYIKQVVKSEVANAPVDRKIDIKG